MVYSPVLITTIFRAEKFRRCIESLARCTGAAQTELYIGVDYPAKESHWAGYRRICDYLPSISGFKAVHVFMRPDNWGQSKNGSDLRNRIRDKYDRYILSEDDNEFSPNYLEYMNQCLERYKDNPDVIQICGYSYVDWRVKRYPYNAFPMQGFSAWGAGKWFSKRDEYANSEFPKIDRIITDPHLVKILFKKKMHIPVHQMMFRTKFKFSGSDVRFRCYCAVHDKFCIFPAVSKVRNLGFDEESTNCIKLDSYAKQTIDDSDTFALDEFQIMHYKEIDRIHDKHYAGGLIMRLTVRLEYFWWRRTGFVLRDSPLIRRLIKLRIKVLGK